MIGISWTEMLVIGVFALIFIGPKELPVVLNRVGKMVGSIRRMGGEFQRELNKVTGLDAVTDIRRSITEPLKKTTAEIAREFNTMTPLGVEPSGAIKPADAKKESVVEEIREQAGMTPTAAAGTVMTTPPAPRTPAQAAAEKSAGAVAAEPVKSGAVRPVRSRKTAAASNGTAAAANGTVRPVRARKAPTTAVAAEPGAAKPVRKRRTTGAGSPESAGGKPVDGTS